VLPATEDLAAGRMLKSAQIDAFSPTTPALDHAETRLSGLVLVAGGALKGAAARKLCAVG
jgi:hypothetical protein